MSLCRLTNMDVGTPSRCGLTNTDVEEVDSERRRGRRWECGHGGGCGVGFGVGVTNIGVEDVDVTVA